MSSLLSIVLQIDDGTPYCTPGDDDVVGEFEGFVKCSFTVSLDV